MSDMQCFHAGSLVILRDNYSFTEGVTLEALLSTTQSLFEETHRQVELSRVRPLRAAKCAFLLSSPEFLSCQCEKANTGSCGLLGFGREFTTELLGTDQGCVENASCADLRLL